VLGTSVRELTILPCNASLAVQSPVLERLAVDVTPVRENLHTVSLFYTVITL